MGLFKKTELTYLEKYKKDLVDYTSSPNITPLEEKRIYQLMPYLEETILNNKKEFLTDELLTDILNYFIEQEKYDTLDEFLYYVSNLYKQIITTNLTDEKDEYEIERLEAIIKRILSGKEKGNSIFELDLFDPLLFNLLKEKENYFQIMSIVCENNKNLKREWNRLVQYALDNREYFSNEEVFTAHLKKVILDTNFAITSGQNPKEVYERNTAENKKRLGIYDLDESVLEELDDIIASADGILEQLRAERKLSDETVLSLKRELKDSIERFKNVRISEEKNMQTKMAQCLEMFNLELKKELQKEVSKFRQDTDTVLNTVNDRVQSKLNEMAVYSEQIDETTRKELQRIRITGNETEEKLRKAIAENPDLEKALSAYMPIPELVEKLSQAQRLVEPPVIVEKKPESSTIQKVPTIIPAKEIPKDINHYFDPRISFESRYRELIEKMKKRESNGEIFHEKFPTLLKMIMEDCNPYLWGNSGLGKTYMINQAFDLLGLEYRPINKILEDYDIIGVMLPNGDYSNPLWYQCYKYGYGAFLDELDSSNSEATIAINSFTSNKKGSFYPFPNGEIVYRHPNFRIVAAGNTAGTGADTYFNDRKQLDESVQQRLMPLYLTPDSRIEKQILKNYPDWFEFVGNFRKTTNEYAKERKLKSAPGELTTRDTAQIKQIKDNHSFTDEEIIEYEIIENKSEDYLGYLVNQMESNYSSGREKSKKLYKTFRSRVDQIRGN